ncbi:MAG: OmpA family protein [Saprospiraceae bacterium]|jgi:outer membrane protein OmpA-like peptidoglycan-associated protein
MSFNQKILFILLAWVIYSAVLLKSCSDDVCTVCGPDGMGDSASGKPALEAPVVADANPYALGFRWSEIQPDRGPGFDSLIAAVRAGRDSSNVLEITGRYFDGEAKPADHETMGLARAGKVRDLYFKDFPEERVGLRSRTMDETEGARVGYFEAIAFQWVAPAAKVEELEELGDRIIIRFPANSTEKEYDPKVDEYLRKLGQRVIRSGEKVQITGHTDNNGSDSANMALGQKRADQIRAILMKGGVPESQVVTDSRGEAQPVAPNRTAAGRHQNRRAEVRLMKKT